MLICCGKSVDVLLDSASLALAAELVEAIAMTEMGGVSLSDMM
jgi:hypothetical protein